MSGEWVAGDPVPERVGGHRVVIQWNEVALTAMLRALKNEYTPGYLAMCHAVRRSMSKSPLVVIDPEDREQAERLADALLAAMCKQGGDRDTAIAYEVRSHMRSALREFANPTPPKPYTEHHGTGAPWPMVGECFSEHISGHECPQCAWEHAHNWVAWMDEGTPGGVPIRCAKCGGRKCDQDGCPERRHTHTHHDEVTP